MKSNLLLSTRRAVSQALIITFISLSGLPSATSATSRGNVTPLTVGGSAEGAAHAPLAGLIEVNTTSDADNLDPNAGCDTDAATPGEQCSLRAAIQRANALAGDDEININIPTTEPSCDPTGPHCRINLTKALPDLSTNIRIISAGLDRTTVRRNSADNFRIFRVTSSADVTISGLRVVNGRPAGINAGGGLSHEGSGMVNVVDSIFTDNVGGTIVASGGAIANSSNGTLTIINSAFADNKATATGGAINNGGSGTLNIISSLIFHNTVTVPGAANSNGSGGGVSNTNDGTVNITNSVINENVITGGDSNTSVLRGAGVANNGNGTINLTGSMVFDNQLFGAGGGVSNPSGSLNVENSTITRNRGNGGGIFGQATVKSSVIAKNNLAPFAGSDVSGDFTSLGFNLVGVADGSTGFTAPTDLKGAIATPLDPKFDPNGAQVSFPSIAITVPGVPICGSPVIDKGLNNGALTDLRGMGFSRTVDDPNVPNAGDGTDIGALERETACLDLAFTVNNTTDANDASPGDGNCDSDAAASGSQCSLRAAMAESNAIGGNYTINFAIPTSDPGYDAASGRHTINLTGALPEMTNSNLTINGPGKDKLTVRRSSGGFYRIFTFSGAERMATISGMTISNAFNSAGDGGAVSFNGKSLTVNSSVFSNNIAAGSGGALFVFATLNVNDTTFNDNFSSAANGGGGAIFARGGLSVTNSTFNSNVANSLGGGINTDSTNATADSNITDSTFNGNNADAGGGVAAVSFSFPLRIVKSTFTNNSSTILNSKGGGIFHWFGKLEVIGCTLTGNEGYGLATSGNSSISTTVVDSTISNNTFGGIETEFATVSTGKLNVTNSTISGNKGNGGIYLSRITLNVSNSTITGNEGAGIRNTLTDSGVWTIKSSIVAGNTGFTDVSGAYTSGGFNLIGNPFNSTGFVNGVNNDQVGANGSPLDPKLDPLGLKDNGGTTHTIALQADSPAIDKGTSAALSGNLQNDQRQVFARTYDDAATANAGDGTDVGAFELQPGGPAPTPTPTPDPSPSPTPDPSPSPTPNPSPSPSPSPTPTPVPTQPQLVVTITSLVRSNCGSIAVGVTVQNTGGTTANNVRLTTGTLMPPTTIGTPLPQNLGNLAAGQWATRVVTFSGTNNAAGQKRTLTFGGTYNGGSFTDKWKVTLP